MSDMKRTDLALEVISNIDRREAIRLRSDIIWAGKRYGESSEKSEVLRILAWPILHLHSLFLKVDK